MSLPSPPPAHRPPAGGADILATGFGTAVLMWAVGFGCRLPGVAAPSALVFAFFILCLLAGGFVAGRYGQRGARGGLYAGLVAGALNLLILGSLLGGTQPNTLARAALLWVPGSLIVTALIAGVGALLGTALPRPAARLNGPAAFALVAAGATFLLLAVGGSVTGFDYGLAVVDWPNTEGYNMFLFPLARMTGGIYFEHSHRLIGSLVGLTTLALAIHLQVVEPRRWVKRLGWLGLGLVVIQGVLGGLRVTGRFTLSTSPADTAPNIALAILHGILGQIFFALLAALTVVQTRGWQQRRDALATPAAGTDRTLAVLLALLLLGQLLLGALVRHLSPALHHLPYGLAATPEELVQRGATALYLHILTAVLVLLVGLAVGLRHWGLAGRPPLLRRPGMALLLLLGVQVILGIAALIVTGDDTAHVPPTAMDVVITTAHQLTGALLLALTAAILACSFRLLVPAAAPARAAAAG